MAPLIQAVEWLHKQGPYVHPNPLVQPMKTARKFKAKHANQKYRLERGQKVLEYYIEFIFNTVYEYSKVKCMNKSTIIVMK